MEMDEDSIDEVLDEVELFMEAFGVDESEIGVVLAPGYSEESGLASFDYFVKAFSEMEPCMDGSFEVEEEVFGGVYGDWVDKFEERFSEAYVSAADYDLFETVISNGR